MQNYVYVTKKALFLSLIATGITFTVHASENDDLKTAMQRDLGLSSTQLDRYIQIENKAADVETQARDQLGAAYVDSWLENDSLGNYKQIVATTSRSKITNNDADIEYRLVKNSAEVLQEAMEKLDRSSSFSGVLKKTNARLGNQNEGIYQWYIDPRKNAVVIVSAPDAENEVVDFVVRSGVSSELLDFEVTDQKPELAINTIGGDRYYVNRSGGYCSVGFPVTKGSSDGFATAGHCNAGQAVHGYNNTLFGSFNQTYFPGGDMAWVRRTSSSWTTTGYVKTSGGSLRVAGSTQAAIGASVCRSGSRTGYRCGVIQQRNVSVNYGGGQVVNGLVRSNACVGQGDSGGSVITPGGQAQGVTSGGSFRQGTTENCSYASSAQVFYQPINPILSRFGLTLKRG